MPDAYRRNADPADVAARAFRSDRHAAGGQLDQPRADAEAQGDPAREGAGRGRARALPVQRDGNARRHARIAGRRTARRPREIRDRSSTIRRSPGPTSARSAGSSTAPRSSIRSRCSGCSYGPYARAMVRICKEESFHQRQGYEIMLALCRGSDGAEGDGAGRAEPLVVAVADDVRAARRASRALRAVDAVEAEASSRTTSCGRSSSTRRCRRRSFSASDSRSEAAVESERGHYDFGAIDWSEFHAWSAATARAIGSGSRITRRAHDDGAWVREATHAYARSRRARSG